MEYCSLVGLILQKKKYLSRWPADGCNINQKNFSHNHHHDLNLSTSQLKLFNPTWTPARPWCTSTACSECRWNLLCPQYPLWDYFCSSVISSDNPHRRDNIRCDGSRPCAGTTCNYIVDWVLLLIFLLFGNILLKERHQSWWPAPNLEYRCEGTDFKGL